MQGGKGCSATERVFAKLAEVRRIVDSKNSFLMQGLACKRWTIYGHSKQIVHGHRKATQPNLTALYASGGRLATDEIVQEERGCLMTERVCAKRVEVREIVNSRSSVLMQGLVYGRQTIRSYPKAIEI